MQPAWKWREVDTVVPNKPLPGGPGKGSQGDPTPRPPSTLSPGPSQPSEIWGSPQGSIWCPSGSLTVAGALYTAAPGHLWLQKCPGQSVVPFACAHRPSALCPQYHNASSWACQSGSGVADLVMRGQYLGRAGRNEFGWQPLPWRHNTHPFSKVCTLATSMWNSQEHYLASHMLTCLSC